MRPPRESLWFSALIAALALAALLALLSLETGTAQQRVALEDQARAQMNLIAAAQAAYHETHGRYGWLGDLREQRLLQGVALRDIEGHLTATSPQYRIDVLLPRASRVGDDVALGLRDPAGRGSPLEREHFAVVARPWGSGLGGWRTYYVDETRTTFVNEGVSDPTTRAQPPLPELRIPEGGRTSPNGMRWWPLHDLPGR